MTENQNPNQNQDENQKNFRRYSLYKGSAAMNMQLIPYGDDSRISGNGCVFLSLAPIIKGVSSKPSKGEKRYDWEKKVIIKLDITDIGKIISALRSGTELSLFHDPGMSGDKQGQERKTINIARMEGNSGFFFSLTHTIGNDVNRVSIPILNEEIICIGILLQAAVPRILGWIE